MKSLMTHRTGKPVEVFRSQSALRHPLMLRQAALQQNRCGIITQGRQATAARYYEDGMSNPKVLDGVAIASAIKAEVAEEVKELAGKGIKPGLAVILVGHVPASEI